MSCCRLSAWLGWLLQRLSGVVMLFLFPVLVISVFNNAPFASFENYTAWLNKSYVCWSIWLMFISMLIHAWIGVKDIVFDYVPKITSHPAGNSVAMGAYAGWLIAGLLTALWIGVL